MPDIFNSFNEPGSFISLKDRAGSGKRVKFIDVTLGMMFLRVAFKGWL